MQVNGYVSYIQEYGVSDTRVSFGIPFVMEDTITESHELSVSDKPNLTGPTMYIVDAEQVVNYIPFVHNLLPKPQVGERHTIFNATVNCYPHEATCNLTTNGLLKQLQK